MCTTFMKYDPNCEECGFKLILAIIRDEYFNRPTQKCCWWQNNRNILGGYDLKNGGTWFAANKLYGKIGILLNILKPMPYDNCNLKSRGFLVADYVSGNKSGQQFLSELQDGPNELIPYTMITVDINEKANNTVRCYHNDDKKVLMRIDSGIHAFGNHGNKEPWMKTITGKDMFSEIVSRYDYFEQRHDMIDDIFQLMDHSKKYFPDEQIKNQLKGRPESLMEALSSLHVYSNSHKCGSRTKTVIVVSADNKVEITNKNMVMKPMSNNFKWECSKFIFQV